MSDESHRQQAPPPAASLDPNGVVKKLQDTFAQVRSFSSTIDLPRVAVVGSQSSGKSSVLEALVGRDFLPKGSDICTRRPLVLQLLQNKDGTDEEYGEFSHIPGRKFYDFNDIRTEIQAETDREAGVNKGISDKEIQLKIFSPYFLDMTLVDLPGITKVPVGDQPSDIEARIRTMIISYIKYPRSLILAVTPANTDLSNSDALQIAGNVDPDGFRTIGVITKLDIMERDAQNYSVLGKVIPLRLGYVYVVNRSQEDIMLNRTIKDALVAEKEFFCGRPVYNKMADRCGVPQLAKQLDQILVRFVNSLLPVLKSRISVTSGGNQIGNAPPRLSFSLTRVLSSSADSKSIQMGDGPQQRAPSSTASLGHNIIPFVNKLQATYPQFSNFSSSFWLPNVAVVGSQSSGKSSVLEALVGRGFLPRSSDICTRRPLVLQLSQIKDGTDVEYGEFWHIPGKKFYDFNEIRIEIQAETDREAGGNKGISDKEIQLRIFLPNVLEITLIDLPGIAKVPVGDQPSDIEARIRTMIMSYIKDPSCLILAVTPANTDLANSDALEIAGNADPDRYRTIGVITKLDIMERGTDVGKYSTLRNMIPLRYGYVFVVNRSQEEDIMPNLTIKDALAAEEEFFRSRRVFNKVADCCGVPQLAKKLDKLLVCYFGTLLRCVKWRLSSLAKEAC